MVNIFVCIQCTMKYTCMSPSITKDRPNDTIDWSVIALYAVGMLAISDDDLQPFRVKEPIDERPYGFRA